MSLRNRWAVLRRHSLHAHAVQELPCGHFMHSHCFGQYTRYNYTCPLCSKSLGDMAVYFQVRLRSDGTVCGSATNACHQSCGYSNKPCLYAAIRNVLPNSRSVAQDVERSVTRGHVPAADD